MGPTLQGPFSMSATANSDICMHYGKEVTVAENRELMGTDVLDTSIRGEHHAAPPDTSHIGSRILV